MFRGERAERERKGERGRGRRWGDRQGWGSGWYASVQCPGLQACLAFSGIRRSAEIKMRVAVSLACATSVGEALWEEM